MSKTPHKNKTLATFLAFALGSTGLHRFYLYGTKDLFAWLYLLSLPITALAIFVFSDINPLFTSSLWIFAVLVAALEAFTLGLKEDDKWDAIHNADSGKTSDSNWVVVLFLCLNLMMSFTVLIAYMARATDLALTGGAFG
jgi:TM2 domain-containing membrane protein YozV